MTDDQIKQYIETAVKDTAVVVKTTTEQTNSDLIGSVKLEHTKITNEIIAIKEGALQHSKEDDVNFKTIHDRLDDGNKKFDEVLSMLKQQNEDITPMLKLFTDNKITRMTIARNGKNVIFWAGGLTIVGAAVTYLYTIVAKLIRPL